MSARKAAVLAVGNRVRVASRHGAYRTGTVTESDGGWWTWVRLDGSAMSLPYHRRELGGDR